MSLYWGEAVLLGIKRAANGKAAPFQDVGVDHRGPEVTVTKEVLHGADVVAVFEEVGSEAVSQGVAGNPLGNPGELAGLADRPLEAASREVLPAH